MNIECDFVDHTSTNLDQYKVLFVPPLYTATDAELQRLNDFAAKGGQVVYALKADLPTKMYRFACNECPLFARGLRFYLSAVYRN